MEGFSESCLKVCIPHISVTMNDCEEELEIPWCQPWVFTISTNGRIFRIVPESLYPTHFDNYERLRIRASGPLFATVGFRPQYHGRLFIGTVSPISPTK